MWFSIEPIIFPTSSWFIHWAWYTLKFFQYIHLIEYFFFCYLLKKINCADPLVMKCHVRWSMERNTTTTKKKRTKINFSYFKTFRASFLLQFSAHSHINFRECKYHAMYVCSFWRALLRWQQMFALLLSLVGLCACTLLTFQIMLMCVSKQNY